MGRATSKGNEAKSEMKHPSDMPTPRFELGDTGSDMWSSALPTRPLRCPHEVLMINCDSCDRIER